MSNEKLGAEEREKLLDAYYQDQGITPEGELRPLVSKLLKRVELAEQAYHARGAWLVAKWKTASEPACNAGDYARFACARELEAELANAVVPEIKDGSIIWCPQCHAAIQVHIEGREPGTDTRTTPPEGLTELVEKSLETQARMNEHANALHDYFAHSIETTEPFDWIEYHRKRVNDLRVATTQRAPVSTPILSDIQPWPEYCFECDDTSRCCSAELCYAGHKEYPKDRQQKFTPMTQEQAIKLADYILAQSDVRQTLIDICDIVDWKALATQRAPVEHGSLKINYVPHWNSQIVAAEVLSEIRGLDVVTCQNEVALHDAIAKVVKRATETAAPDHAREGALRELVAKWRERKQGRSSGEQRGMNHCADELEQMLKGGE